AFGEDESVLCLVLSHQQTEHAMMGAQPAFKITLALLGPAGRSGAKFFNGRDGFGERMTSLQRAIQSELAISLSRERQPEVELPSHLTRQRHGSLRHWQYFGISPLRQIDTANVVDHEDRVPFQVFGFKYSERLAVIIQRFGVLALRGQNFAD